RFSRDWSSDVCSSDLGDGQVPQDRQVWEQVEVLEDHADPGPKQVDVGVWIGDVGSFDEDRAARGLLQTVHTAEQRRFPGPGRTEIGRASCRECIKSSV